MPIDCAGCQACCKGPDRVLYVEEGPWVREGGKLAQKANGDCLYLCESGCSIYESRPEPCRRFDCRDYLWDHVPDRVKRAARARL